MVRAMSEPGTFTVREMALDDISEVYALGKETFTAEKWPMLYRNWDEYEVTNLFNTDGEYCLVAESDHERPRGGERIVGFVLGSVLSKPGSAWTYGYVNWLCAHPKWTRAGVATRLVDKLVERMIENDGIRIVMADTDPENERAVRFFEKMGFVDRQSHVYLSSNIEQNERYQSLLDAYRDEQEPEPPPKPKPKPRPRSQKGAPAPKASARTKKTPRKRPAPD